MNESDIRNFDLNLLLVLQVLLEERNVTRAAERLHVSQSAVSHALKRLREKFADPLFARGQSGMHPTPRAETLAAPIRQILEQAGSLVAPSRFDASKYRGVFRIAATDYSATVLFPELVRRMRHEAPNLTLECVFWTDQTLAQIDKGIVDLALGGQKPFKGFEHSPLFLDRLVCLVDGSHPLASKRKITYREFVAYPHATISVSASRMKIVDEKLRVRGLARHVALRLPYFVSAPVLVQGTDIILIIPEVGARKFAPNSNMRILPLPFQTSDFHYIQVWGKKQSADPLNQWMRETIAAISQSLLGRYN